MKYLSLFLLIPNFIFCNIVPVFLEHEINTSDFLSFLKKAKMENQQNMLKYSNQEDRSMFMFHLGKDVAYADVMEYFRND